MTTDTKPHVIPMVGRMTNEARSARTFVKSIWAAHQMSRQRNEVERQLAELEQEIGGKAEAGSIGATLPAMALVRAERAQVAATEAALQEKGQLLAAARGRLDAATRAGDEAVGALRPEQRRLSAAADAAAAALQTARNAMAEITRSIHCLEAILQAPPAPVAVGGTSAPISAAAIEETRTELASLNAAREPAATKVAAAEQAYEAARAASDAKAAEIDRALEQGKRQTAEQRDAVTAAEAELACASETLAEKKAALEVAHLELGRAICDAGIQSDVLAGSMVKAEPLLKKSHDTAIGAAELRVRADYAKQSALHVALAIGGLVLAVLILALTLLVAALRR